MTKIRMPSFRNSRSLCTARFTTSSSGTCVWKRSPEMMMKSTFSDTHLLRAARNVSTARSFSVFSLHAPKWTSEKWAKRNARARSAMEDHRLLLCLSSEVFEEWNLHWHRKTSKVARHNSLADVEACDSPVVLRQILSGALNEGAPFGPHLVSQDDFRVHICKDVPRDEGSELRNRDEANQEL